MTNSWARGFWACQHLRAPPARGALFYFAYVFYRDNSADSKHGAGVVGARWRLAAGWLTHSFLALLQPAAAGAEAGWLASLDPVLGLKLAAKKPLSEELMKKCCAEENESM